MRRFKAWRGLRTGIAVTLAVVAVATPAETQEKPDGAQKAPRGYSVPFFRHVDPTEPAPDTRSAGRIRIVTSDDFPPFSYRDSTGRLTGFSVSLINSVCKDLRLRCSFVIQPFENAIATLEAGKANVVLSGLRRTAETYEKLQFTRPYFRYLARFAVRTENTIGEPTPRAFDDKSIAVVKGSAHAAFLARFYPKSKLMPFDTFNAAAGALRASDADALFADGTQMMFWINGASSAGCCRFAAGAINHRTYFNNGLSIAVKLGDTKLVRIFDHGLNRQQNNGNTARIFRRFFPVSPW